MIYRVRHVTSYIYNDTVTVAHHMAHLTPRSFETQTCRRTALRITPTPTSNREGVDYFGNPVTWFTLQDSHRRLTVEALSRVQVTRKILPAPEQTPPWEKVVEQLHHAHGSGWVDSIEFCYDSPFVRIIDGAADYARPSFPPGRPVLACLLDLTHRIFTEFTYDPTATTVATPLERVLSNKRGVCQDFAHLQIACLRAMGLAARYVSGYLLTRPPPGKIKLRGSDASHAWLSCLVPDLGWIDLDPTNDCIPTGEHIVTAWGRDFGDVSPLRGVVLGGGDHCLNVAVDVEPLENESRPRQEETARL